ncbi:MAG: mannose-6-phosphate isomerase, class [Pseudomonadota bacterium]|jgi:mannose-6-phosphate isomerase
MPHASTKSACVPNQGPVGTVVVMYFHVSPHLARYPWGHQTQIGAWLHRVDIGAAAEAWFGTHRSGSATLADGSTLTEQLGGPVHALPWLAKLIAAAEPLSLQVHPSAAHASARFAAQHPSYVDPFGKPEVLVALMPTVALLGFDDIVSATTRARSLGLTDLVDLLRDGPAAAATALWRDPQRSALISAAVAAASDDMLGLLAPVARRWAHDPFLAVACCLRPVRLAPGEAVEIEPGLVHAYLSGGGLEVMDASDNVLRGGLTAKPLDVDELLVVLDPVAEPRFLTVPAAGRLATSSITASVHRHAHRATYPAPAFVWCTDGPMVASGPASMRVDAGATFFVPEEAGSFTLAGGAAWVVATPDATHDAAPV